MLGHQLHEKAGEAVGDISHVIASMHVKKLKAKKRTLQNQMVVWYHSLESIHMTTFVQQLLPQSRCAIVNGGKKKIVDSCESYDSPITLAHVINKLWQIVWS